MYSTIETRSRKRWVIGKGGITECGENPRFIVTSFRSGDVDAWALYERTYCARGEMWDRIKEQQLDLIAARSPATG